MKSEKVIADLIANKLFTLSDFDQGDKISFFGDETERFCEALRNNQSLRTLHFSTSNMFPTHMAEIFKAIKVNVKLPLTEISYSSSNRYLKLDDEKSQIQAQELVTLLQSNHTLTTLVFDNGFSFPKTTASNVLSAIRMNPKLFIRELDLSGLFLGEQGVQELVEWLRFNETLYKINLVLSLEYPEKNPGQSQISVFQAIKSNPKTSIKEINSRTSSHSFPNESFPTFISLIKTNQSIEIIDLRWFQEYFVNWMIDILEAVGSNKRTAIKNILLTIDLNEEIIEAFVKFLKCNKTLEIIDVSQSNVSDVQLFSIFEAIHGNQDLALIDLNVSINSMGVQAAQSLSKLLKSNQTLSHLSFSECDLTDILLADILRSIQLNSKSRIKKIDFSANTVGEKSFTALKEWLSLSQTIESIDFSFCSSHEMAACLQSIAANPKSAILELDFSGILMDGEVVQALANLLQINETIKTLIFGEQNSITINELAKLFNAIKVNPKSAVAEIDILDCHLEQNGVDLFMSFLQSNRTINSIAIDWETTFKAFKELLKSNKNIVKVIGIDTLKSENGYWKQEIEEIDAALERNKTIAEKQQFQWGRLAIALSFYRANQDSHIKSSILALVPGIMKHLNLEVFEEEKKLDLDKSINSLFFQSHLKMPLKGENQKDQLKRKIS